MLRMRGELPTCDDLDLCRMPTLSPGSDELLSNEVLLKTIQDSLAQVTLESDDEGSSTVSSMNDKRKYDKRTMLEMWDFEARCMPTTDAQERMRSIPEHVFVKSMQSPELLEEDSNNKTRWLTHHNSGGSLATSSSTPGSSFSNKKHELSPGDQCRLERTIHLMGIDASQSVKTMLKLVSASGRRPIELYRLCGEVNERRTTRFAFIEMQSVNDALACVQQLHLTHFGANILQCHMAKTPIYQGTKVGSAADNARIGGKQMKPLPGRDRFAHHPTICTSIPSTAESSPASTPSHSTSHSHAGTPSHFRRWFLAPELNTN
eukprot:TRINITY_DN27650_c0_g1_i1.p1 TRINITY_DN27650_c0_g1~~TRINITY_DN27650_c0_g1_i1.p1  ORF type:complete len:319 (+),score=35.73 TRINITY_DN27650_c0_g1_i1:97-1053(+)